ncbi:ABC transporter permease subunit [Neolewinella antarctica]|uniref:Cu-processing system permease protein n=1 Tax=Neolewinella antarctica TaxID=442734 RepID=A0ABX0XCH4_9BACT|nr:ABC transporter permease subunit [Neolewinella antarctica]NJC26981.1 Cu-processing system permease protein [Neolewinella antarctica]
MLNISKIIIWDLWKNKAVIAYGILMLTIGWGVFAIEDQPEKAVLSLLRIILFVQPLVTLLFAGMYYYNSQEFILLLAAQPVRRNTLFFGVFAGLTAVFTLIFLLSIGLPVLLFSPNVEGLSLLFAGALLIFIFTALALLVSVYFADKARGLGFALLLWAFFAFVYDGLLLLFMYQLADYPIERPVLGLLFFNPVDVARIFVISKTEASALLGLSGAVFQDFFGAMKGTVISGCVLATWALVPLSLAYRKFNRKDL